MHKSTAALLTLLVIILAGPLAPPASAQGTEPQWTPWQPIHGAREGEGGGIDISFRHGRFIYSGGGHAISYRFRNRYDRPVVMEVELALQGGSVPRTTQLAKIPAGAVDQSGGMYNIAHGISTARMLRFGFGTDYSALGPRAAHVSGPAPPPLEVQYNQRDAQGQPVDRTIWREGSTMFCSQTPRGRSGPEVPCTFAAGDRQRTQNFQFRRRSP